MDLCEESETFLENKENKKIEDTEEPAPTLHCPDERSERSHVCCLLGVSDLTLEEDGRASEFAISTGWEEAVSAFLGLSHLSIDHRAFSKVVYVTENVIVSIGALERSGNGHSVCSRAPVDVLSTSL